MLPASLRLLITRRGIWLAFVVHDRNARDVLIEHTDGPVPIVRACNMTGIEASAMATRYNLSARSWAATFLDSIGSRPAVHDSHRGRPRRYSVMLADRGRCLDARRCRQW